MIHCNLKFICLVITTNISNCYIYSVGLFIIGGGELQSKEGKNKGDPRSMVAYTLDMMPVLQFQLNFIFINEINSKEVAFTDDFISTGILSSIKKILESTNIYRPKKWLLFSKASKSDLIVKRRSATKCYLCYLQTQTSLFFVFLFLLKFTPCKAEQLTRGMKLQKKK